VSLASTVRSFWRDERGATAVEYALIGGIMMLAVIAIAGTGGALGTIYDRVSLLIAALGG